MRLTRADVVHLLLLWLGGIDLRLTMLAVPPLIPLIHRDLHLDEKAVGALVSLPVLLLAVAAVPGSLLIAKLGIRTALAIGLGAVAVFSALRGAGSSTTVLFGSSFLMGLGVAVSQPAFPALVREWFPRRIAVATAVFSNGILIGETIPNVFTTPFRSPAGRARRLAVRSRLLVAAGGRNRDRYGGARALWPHAWLCHAEVVAIVAGGTGPAPRCSDGHGVGGLLRRERLHS